MQLRADPNSKEIRVRAQLEIEILAGVYKDSLTLQRILIKPGEDLDLQLRVDTNFRDSLESPARISILQLRADPNVRKMQEMRRQYCILSASVLPSMSLGKENEPGLLRGALYNIMVSLYRFTVWGLHAIRRRRGIGA